MRDVNASGRIASLRQPNSNRTPDHQPLERFRGSSPLSMEARWPSTACQLVAPVTQAPRAAFHTVTAGAAILRAFGMALKELKVARRFESEGGLPSSLREGRPAARQMNGRRDGGETRVST